MHMSKALVLALVGSINAAADFDLTCGNIVAKGTTLRADCGGPTTTLDLNQCLTVKDDGTVECGKGGGAKRDKHGCGQLMGLGAKI
ncbi:hypothetical protein MCOR11_004481 [Pyricularia oryzae]|nr:hypothetical protein MCOR26_005713 [Pyricularia oryzae]KAI6497437.1 hypothetical protein MCOR11_004481 [Pyricularia oryzae]